MRNGPAMKNKGKKVPSVTVKKNSTEAEVYLYNEQSLIQSTYAEYSKKNHKCPEGQSITWINVDGISDTKVIEEICAPYKIHPLIIEDILVPNQRAKIEEYENYTYFVLKMIYYNQDEIIFEQLSVLLLDHVVITFGETKGDVFKPIRTRLQTQGSPLRSRGADYLLYNLLDAIVDGYFDVLERLGEEIDAGEEELLGKGDISTLHTMREFKKSLLYMHKAIWPLREVLSRINHDNVHLILPETQLYLRDVYDHIYQAIDTTETYRELLSGLMDLYLSSISNRMNEIMKVLTIISTIFIPLTFLAGVYGMNFKYMPELSMQLGYPVLWVVMIVIAAAMLIFFKRRRWF